MTTSLVRNCKLPPCERPAPDSWPPPMPSYSRKQVACRSAKALRSPKALRKLAALVEIAAQAGGCAGLHGGPSFRSGRPVGAPRVVAPRVRVWLECPAEVRHRERRHAV